MEENNITLEDLDKKQPEPEEESITIDELVSDKIPKNKRYKCTLTGHETNSKAAIYKYRNYLKKLGTCPDGKGKIMYIGEGVEPKFPKKPAKISFKIEDESETAFIDKFNKSVEAGETATDPYAETPPESQKEQMYSHLKMLEHEAKNELNGYKIKSTPESSTAAIKEEIQFVVSILQNKGLSKTAYQLLVAMAGFTETITQHEKLNPYVDLSGFSSAIQEDEKDIQEVLARCVRDAPVEFQNMLTPQSHLFIIMTSIAVKVNSQNQEKKKQIFLGKKEVVITQSPEK